MTRCLFAFLLLAALFFGPAEPTAAGSIYSSEGYGWWWDEGDAASRGRGGTSVATGGYGSAGAVNPAGIALTGVTYGIASYSGEISSVSDGDDSYRQRADLLPLLGGVIVLPKGLRIAGVLRTQTDAAYDRERTVEGNPAVRVRTEGRGGWNRFQLNLAGPSLDGRLLWGLGISRVQGIVKELWQFDFDDPSAIDLRQAIRGRMKGGWVGSGGVLLQAVPDLRVGLAGSLGGTSPMVQEVETLSGASSLESISGRQELPAQLVFGLAGSPVRYVSLSAEAVRTYWGDAGLRTTPGGPMTHPYQDTDRIAVGLEYARGSQDEVKRTYRIGYARTDSYVRASDGSKIVERSGSIGLRTPIGRGRAALDLALELGKRGSLDDLAVEESFVRISAGVVFSSVPREY